MLTFDTIAELRAAVAASLGTTEWTRVTQDAVDAFADVTGDHQWIHVDTQAAAASRFGSTIVHGYFTLAMLPSFASSLFRITAGSARLNYGINKVRFPAPVPVGSQVRASAHLLEVQSVAAGTQVVISWVVQSDASDRPACVAETIVLVVP